MTRLTYVPLQSVIVVRDGKQIDALEDYKSTGKAFKFTADEVKEIAATNGGDSTMVLRDPTDEVEDEETVPLASNTQAAEPAALKPAKADKNAAKDTDL